MIGDMRLEMTDDEIAADRERWLKVRQGTVGASDIASIMGLPGAYGTPTSVYWSKVAGDSLPATLRLRIGLHMESLVVALCEEMRPDWLIQPGGLYTSQQRPWQSATFDRIAVVKDPYAGSEHVPVQIKTSHTMDGYGEDGTDEIPPHYLAQVIWEMSTGQFRRAFVPVLFLSAAKLHIYEVPWDAEAQADLDAMIGEARTFMNMVASRRPPPVDWRPATTSALKRVYGEVIRQEVIITKDLERRLRRAKELRRHSKEYGGQAENELRQRLGSADTAIDRDGNVVATRTVSPVKGHYRKASTRDAITVREGS